MSSDRTLDQRTLGRTLLHRQLLLERTDLAIPEALEQVGGLQTQYAPSGYVGLWTRLTDFRRDALTRALEDATAIQATLMRTTIHVVSRRDFWLYAMGVRQARRTWALRLRSGVDAVPDERAMIKAADAMRAALADGPRTVKELGAMGAGFVGSLGLWVDLVRVPPSGTWERRRADRLALAETWVGRPDATEAEGLTHLVRAYLRGFGPAAWKDIASWAGISVTDARRGGEHLTLSSYRDADGRALVDLAGATVIDGRERAPVRFLPHWDASLLVHARRTGVLPGRHRTSIFGTKMPFSVGTVLVDGQVAAIWSLRDDRIVVTELEPIAPAAREAIEAERVALERYHA